MSKTDPLIADGRRAPIIDDRPPTPPPPPPKPIVLGGAIGQRYNELGGKKWGYPQHTEKATPDGRGRYVHFRDHPQRQGTTMSIYWSPETGAHEIFGQIRNLWESLGWERSFLGYPTSGELATHDGVGRWQTFQGGIIVWHPDTGAHEVHGDILTRYGQLGGSAWGYPVTNETRAPDGRGRYNHFRNLETGGELSIYWTQETKAHEVFGLIRNGWVSYGSERSLLGYPTSGETATGDGGGRWQTFEGGIYVWHPDTGAHEVHGAILERYAALGGSDWAYPITDEGDAKGPGRFNHFRDVKTGAEKSIHWSPETGAVETYGLIRQRWAWFNWEHSYLGYPVSPEANWPQGGPGSRQQQFQGGRILYRASDNATAADPMIWKHHFGKGAGFGFDLDVEIRPDGNVKFSGRALNSPTAEGYDYDINTTLRHDPSGVALFWRTSDHLPAAVAKSSRRTFSQTDQRPIIASNYFALQDATLDVQQHHEGDITGAIDDILTTLLAWSATAALGPTALAIIYGGIGLGTVISGGSFNGGLRIASGTLWMLGPGGFLLAVPVDALASIGSQHRGLTAEEITLVDRVFRGSLDFSRIELTDTKGGGGRPFTFLGENANDIKIHLGDHFKKTPDLNDAGYRTRLVHELAHAWQWQYMGTDAKYVIDGIGARIGEMIHGKHATYDPGSPGRRGRSTGSKSRPRSSSGGSSFTTHTTHRPTTMACRDPMP